MRAHLLPAALRYVPPEANVVVGAGDIRSLWDGVNFHFGRVVREQGRDSFLGETLIQLGEERRVAHKADLVCRHGIDIDRGILEGFSLELGNVTGSAAAAFERATEHRRRIMVIPVASDGRVVEKYCAGGAADVSTPQPSDATNEQPCAKLQDGLHTTKSEIKLVRFFCSKQAVQLTVSGQTQSAQYPCDSSILLGARGADPSWKVSEHAYKVDDEWLVFPEPDTALLSDSCEFLDTALGEQERNLFYARADDSLFEAVRFQLRRPLLSGPGVLVYVRNLAADLAPVGTAAAAVNLAPDAVLADVRIQTSGVSARIVDHALAAAQEQHAWRSYTDDDDAAVLVLRDPATSRYLDSASSNPRIGQALKGFFGGILEPARGLKSLEQVVIRGIGYEQGLPQIMIGMWGDAKEFDQLTYDVQRKLRDSRDRAILDAALLSIPAEPGDRSRSLTELLQSVDLTSEANTLGRFRLEGSTLESDPLTPKDFAGPDYIETYRQYQIVYLEPAITIADRRFRFDKVDDEEASILLENRYRLASVHIGNVLWVGTGKHELVSLIDRLSRDAEPDEFSVDLDDDGERNKLRLAIGISNVIRTGMLSGEELADVIVDQMLLDFRYHREIVITLNPEIRAQGLAMTFEARGPDVAQPPSPAGEETRTGE
jgi:hypothetical protein